MRGIGVVQDGFPFTWAELDRGAPRFWWSAGRKRAYAAALAGRDEADGSGATGGKGSDAVRVGVSAGVAHVATGGFAGGHGAGDAGGGDAGSQGM